MSSLVGILIINLVVFLGFIFIVFLLFSKGVKRINFSASPKKNIRVLGGYIIILLCSMLLYFLIPEDKFEVMKGIADNENGFILYERLMEKENIEDRYLTRTKSYNLSGNELLIRSKDHYYQEYSIMFEKTSELTNKIDVWIYNGLFVINQYDFSDQVPLPTIYFSDNLIEVEHPTFYEKNMAQMTPEFPFTQFSGERQTMDGSSSSLRDGIIYIRVPEDVDVIWEKEFIDVIEVK